MGQISGVNASSITNIAGIAVANISYVGPTSAATLGLGGGGGGGTPKSFSTGYWEDPGNACAEGPVSIAERGAQTVYYSAGSNALFTDSSLTTAFNGNNGWWYNQTDNQSWFVFSEGGVNDTFACR